MNHARSHGAHQALRYGKPLRDGDYRLGAQPEQPAWQLSPSRFQQLTRELHQFVQREPAGFGEWSAPQRVYYESLVDSARSASTEHELEQLLVHLQRHYR